MQSVLGHNFAWGGGGLEYGLGQTREARPDLRKIHFGSEKLPPKSGKWRFVSRVDDDDEAGLSSTQ